ncbi:MAG: hypothetical protein OXD33_09525 [Rhodobacteraceae bacterium]|nr:hypothetical protein [Paracoccaceae bacterium]MCY4328113.1 hypothetical protein [Paracoccaceae bacterium]
MIRKIGSWTARRFGLGQGSALQEGAESMRRAAAHLRPARTHLSFHHWLCHGRAPVEIPPDKAARDAAAGDCRTAARVWLICAATMVILVIVFAIAGATLFLLGPLAASLAMVIAGMQRDWAAWCLQSNHNHPPIAYLRRCPHIIWR